MPTEDILRVHPQCLIFFTDETGHEEFADPQYPVFGMGGCVVHAHNIERLISTPWRALKDKFFGGAGKPLHASELRQITIEQAEALGTYFRTSQIGRFAVTMSVDIDKPRELQAIQVMPGALQLRWDHFIKHSNPAPPEVALVHEASERGDKLLERHFPKMTLKVNGRDAAVHHGIIPKSAGLEALEVADFIAYAAGRQAFNRHRGKTTIRKDFAAVFRVDPLLTSLFHVTRVVPSPPPTDPK